MRRLAVLAVGAALLAGCGDDQPSPEQQAKEVRTALAGIPQDGITLGSLQAPATLTVFARPSDYGFEQWVVDDLPELAAPIKAGKVKLQYRTLAGGADATSADDDQRLAGLLQAAGLQDKLYDLLAVVSAQYAGYLDDLTVNDLLRAVPGLSARDVRASADDPRITAAIERAGKANTFSRPGVRVWTLSRGEGSSPEVLRTPEAVAAAVAKLG